MPVKLRMRLWLRQRITMEGFTNAQKLAAVVTEWARPAISSIAGTKVLELPFMRSLQAAICGSGLVGENYSLGTDIQPLIMPVVNSIFCPMVESAVSNIPDHAIPAMARNIVHKMKNNGSFSILDGLVTFETSDIERLEDLLRKNLPVEEGAKYQVIK